MCRTLRSRRAIGALEISKERENISEPLLPFIRRTICDNNEPISIERMFGACLLFSTFKTFFRSMHASQKRNCRVETLQFAQNACEEILATAPTIEAIKGSRDQLLGLYAVLLRRRAADLHRFICEKRFDLYYASPWIAGCHMVEILNIVFSDGLELCDEIGYVCAVLHLYHALRGLRSPINRIALLDQLCQVFKRHYSYGLYQHRILAHIFEGQWVSGLPKSQRRIKLETLLGRRKLFPSRNEISCQRICQHFVNSTTIIIRKRRSF